MALAVGWHHLTDDLDADPLPSATFLDATGAAAGMRSRLRLCRLYSKGRQRAAELMPKARHWIGRGCYVTPWNEWNHPVEGFDGTPEEQAASFAALLSLLTPEERKWVYWPAPSPGFAGWERWYDGAELAAGVTAHAYGTYPEMKATVEYAVRRFPGKPIWVSECNFGPAEGKVVDLNRWTEWHLKPFLSWCAGQAQIIAVSYFAFQAPHADWPQGTPVDGAGTRIERVLRAWAPPLLPVATSGNYQKGATVATLKEQYPQIYAEWENIGGVESNFRQHLIGIGAITPTRDDLRSLVHEARATINQIEGVIDKLPFA